MRDVSKRLPKIKGKAPQNTPAKPKRTNAYVATRDARANANPGE